MIAGFVELFRESAEDNNHLVSTATFSRGMVLLSMFERAGSGTEYLNALPLDIRARRCNPKQRTL
jgi:hypothetical protein